jgi:hypothetical protein
MLKRLIVMCTVMSAGCALGTNINKHPAATSPAGVTGFVSVDKARSYEGELLSISDDRYVMLVANRVIAVPLASSARFYFKPFAHGWGVPESEQLARMRRASRFPYGIPDAVLAALLTRSGQTVIEEVH